MICIAAPAQSAATNNATRQDVMHSVSGLRALTRVGPTYPADKSVKHVEIMLELLPRPAIFQFKTVF